MIRGKKNYLPPCQLIMGLGFLFRLEDSSIERHLNERRVRTLEDGEDIDHVVEAYNEIEIEEGEDEDGKKVYIYVHISKNFKVSSKIIFRR